MGDLAKDAIQEWERYDGDRSNFKSSWQDISNHMLPDRNDYVVEKSPGQKRMQMVFDGTPVWALEQFAAGLHSLLTSPSLRWFGLKAEDDALNQRDDVRLWLEYASDEMYSVFNGPRHNFASQSHELYLDLGSVGTGVMACLESARSGILFSTRHLKECVIAENEEDRVDLLVRRWKYSAKQAVEAWGKDAGEKVVKAMADGKEDTKFEFLHSVKPRRSRDPQRRDKLHKAFQSVYVSVADMHEIKIDGFDEFPYLVPRFSKVTGETWGRGPGWTVLPDVKMLYQMMKTILKAAQKVVDPALQVPDEGFLMPVKTVPGSMNYYRANSPGRIEPIKTGGDIHLGIDMISALRQQIIRGFYVEWLMMPSDPRDPAAAGKGVTATYVLQQRDEKMRLLSPMLARLQSEFLGPLIDRVFAIMWRRRMFKLAPPPALSGVPLRVDYVSPIALAQKSSQMDGVGRLIALAQSMMPINPQAGQALDTDAILRIAAKDLNTPVAAVKSADQLAQERQAAAEAQQQINQHMQLQSLAGTAKDGTAALKNLAQARSALPADAVPANDQQVAA